MDLIQAAILGIVEGLTEFLPVSSTGHLILTAHILNIPHTNFTKTFEISIQLGSILAVFFSLLRKTFKRLGNLEKDYFGLYSYRYIRVFTL